MKKYPQTIGMLLFDEVELLDFAGPFEVFSVAQLRQDIQAFNVVTLGEKATIKTRNGLSVNTDYLIQDSPPIDILLIPGGQGTRKELENDILMSWLKRKVMKTPLVLSVCTGALLIASRH